MYRWHLERTLMLRRAHDEHGEGVELGRLRKRRPHDCGNPRCGLCHSAKVYEPKRRAAGKRRAIRGETEEEEEEEEEARRPSRPHGRSQH